MKILPTDFEGQSIRRVYDEATERWWFSVVDVMQVLSGSANPKRYWSDLKRRVAKEAGPDQPYAEIVRLKLPSPDGKQRGNRLRAGRHPAAPGSVGSQPQSRAY